MTTAEHLDLIDRLRAQAFVDRPVRLGAHSSGPGYHLVRLDGTGDFWEDDGSGRAEAAGQISAEYAALVQALTIRWGAPDVFPVVSPARRGTEGAELEEPWEELGNSADHVHLWRTGDRWLVVCAARWGEEGPHDLMAAVTVTDPP
ncbi:hypothetical protein OOK31_26960 [Streptomyces sp. NBC_00249]|uniref:hypothetical protein n=1 Tax=Streptomyces sp. NBC_00249 TaxID=2975690 RepID=UPI0022553E0D|nr:hypothetical protein [Streptomyces sp. NBC_00249]MCX5197492.1 hypothetical protein [Streptomyces sp. NBC_00249]